LQVVAGAPLIYDERMRPSAFAVAVALVAILAAPVACSSDSSAGPSSGGFSGTGASGGAGSGGDAASSGGSSGASGACGTSSPATLAACVDADGYQSDVVLVTGERPPDAVHWKEVQDHCRDTLTGLGFSVELHDYGTGVNVIGTRPGKTKPGEHVLMGAHYDHIPGCPGADDNATGTAAVLELARVLSKASFDRTLVAACFDEEETGLLGSKAYVARALKTGENIVGVMVFDMIGYVSSAPNSQKVPPGIDAVFPAEYAELAQNQFRADFILLAHDAKSQAGASAFAAHAKSIGLRAVRLELPPALMALDDMRRSDHAPFWDMGFPATFVGDSAELRYPAYHCKQGDDVVANLSFDFAAQTLRAAAFALATELGMDGGSSDAGSGGSGGGDGGFGVTSCAGLCALVPIATQAQGICASDAFAKLGYPILTTPACANVTTTAQCGSCVAALSATDAHCASVYASCF